MRRIAAFALVVAFVTVVGPANAHGPTVRVAWSGVQPGKTTVRAGATVHFQNGNASGSPCTLVADDGSFESPTLGRAEGWHHVFAEPGTFTYHVKEMTSARGTIVVVGSQP